MKRMLITAAVVLATTNVFAQTGPGYPGMMGGQGGYGPQGMGPGMMGGQGGYGPQGMGPGMMGGQGGYGPQGMGPGMMGGQGGYGPQGMGPGMMGGQGGYGPQGMGPGMMGGQGGYGPQGMGPGMMGGWGRQGVGPGGRGPWGLGAIDLTDSQREKIAEIQEDARRKHWDLMGEMHSQGYAISRWRGPADDAEARKAYDAMAAAQKKMFDLSLETRRRIDQVLTPEQRDKLNRGQGRATGGQ